MPEIASVVPIAPAAPAQGTLVSPMAASPAGAEAGAADFLAQLKAALKGLANAVAPVLPAMPAMPATPPTAQDTVSAAATPLVSSPEVPAKTDGPQGADMPEILAALGFVLVPTPVQPPATTTPGPSESAPGAPRLSAPQAVVTERLASVVRSLASPSTEAADKPAAAPADSTSTPVATQAPSPTQTTPQPGQPPQAPSSDVSMNTVAAPQVAPQSLAEPRQHTESAAPAPTAPAAGAIGARPQGQPATNFSSSDSSDSGEQHEHGSRRAGHVAEIPQADTAAPANEQTFTAAVASTSAPSQPAAAQPSQVVAQIAHQADLYRLPGNRGVRIQLHPDDLGGVQVTLRYAPAGGLELHINVEHASTGALVQAGWTELRDALATQGISPDRLVMSVTSPSTASQLDFSSNGQSGYRSDSGLAGFTQGDQSGQQQRHDDDQALPKLRTWRSGSESTSSSDDTPRVAAPAAASRIDYRV
jgi:flagellar hook-length control protein FliK